MSALIGVSKRESIDLLTDAASTRAEDGIIAEIGPKMFLQAVPQTVIATTGWMPPCTQFAWLAQMRCPDFDAVVVEAPALWGEVRAMVAVDALWVEYAVLVAGWSERRRRLELRELHSKETPTMEDLAVCAHGPTDAAGEATRRFVAKFAENTERFDACLDGVALMEELRGRYPRQFQTACRPCVGGHVQLTTITRTGAATGIIHRWPDRVGESITLQKEAA